MEKIEKSIEDQNLEKILSSKELAQLELPKNQEPIKEGPESNQQKISEKLEEINTLPEVDIIDTEISSKNETSFDFPPKKEKFDLLDSVKKWGKRFLVTTAFTASSLTGFAKGGEKSSEDKEKKSKTESANIKKISTSELSPEYIFLKKEDDKNFWEKTKKVKLETAQPGKTGDIKEYEKFLQRHLANGVTPQELADKKYISSEEISKYNQFYKPSVEVVYTQSDRGNTVPFNTGLEVGMKQVNIELKENQPRKVEINKSYIINVRGDDKDGAYYVVKDEQHLREIEALIAGGFSTAEYRYNYGGITVNMNNNVFINNWMNTPEKKSLLGNSFHRDPKNSEYIIEDVSSTTNTTDIIKN